MRNFLMAAAVVTSVGLCTGAFASDYNTSFSSKTTAYLNFGFGGSGKSSDILSSLHYGLRMDPANPGINQQSSLAINKPARPAFMQADFNLRDGFSGASVNGVRFAAHMNKFDEDGGDSSYSAFDWGLLAVGVAGLGFGIAEVLKTKDSPDPKTTGTSGGTTGGVGGIPVVGPVLCSLPLVNGLCPSSFDGAANSDGMTDYARLNWLDSGTGHMGDLITVR